MKVQFLGQGYEPESKNAVGKWLKKLLSDKRFHSFTALTAFTSVGGIEELFEEIELGKEHLKNILIVTGIDQKVTPKEALSTLLELDIEAYIFSRKNTNFPS